METAAMDFEQACDPNAKNGTPKSRKYPLRRVEPSLRKFIKVLHMDLERLKRHQINIEKYESAKDYVSLHKEHIYATRTVQQLKSNIKQLEHTRSQVLENDLGAFEKQVNDVQEEAVEAVRQFLRNHAHKSSEHNPFDGEPHPVEGDESTEDLDPLHQDQLLISQGKDEATQESLDELVTNLEELNIMIHTFSQLVHCQGESVNAIEDNVEKASDNVSAGIEHLRKAALLKSTLYPLAGAIVGGALGGPVGLIAGLKLGGLAAVGGGIAGVCNCDGFVGRYIRYIAVLEEEIHKEALWKRDAEEAFPANVPPYISTPLKMFYGVNQFQAKFIDNKHCWLSQTLSKYYMANEWFMWEMKDELSLFLAGGCRAMYSDMEQGLEREDIEQHDYNYMEEEEQEEADNYSLSYDSEDSAYGSDTDI